MEETAIVAFARTPFGKFGGALKSLSATDLGGIAIREAVKRAGISPEMVDYAYIGQVLQEGCGQIPSRGSGYGVAAICSGAAQGDAMLIKVE